MVSAESGLSRPQAVAFGPFAGLRARTFWAVPGRGTRVSEDVSLPASSRPRLRCQAPDREGGSMALKKPPSPGQQDTGAERAGLARRRVLSWFCAGPGASDMASWGRWPGEDEATRSPRPHAGRSRHGALHGGGVLGSGVCAVGARRDPNANAYSCHRVWKRLRCPARRPVGRMPSPRAAESPPGPPCCEPPGISLRRDGAQRVVLGSQRLVFPREEQVGHPQGPPRVAWS